MIDAEIESGDQTDLPTGQPPSGEQGDDDRPRRRRRRGRRGRRGRGEGRRDEALAAGSTPEGRAEPAYDQEPDFEADLDDQRESMHDDEGVEPTSEREGAPSVEGGAPQGEDRPRRRRRRGRRGRRGGRRDEYNAGDRPTSGVGATPAVDAEGQPSESAPPPTRSTEERSRGDRNRGDRNRRDQRPRVDERSSRAEEIDELDDDRDMDDLLDEDDLEDEAESLAPVDDHDDLDDENHEDDLLADQDEGEEGDVHAPHRKIPTWEETVGILISSNMESRAKNPHSGGHHRGRGRGGRGR